MNVANRTRPAAPTTLSPAGILGSIRWVELAPPLFLFAAALLVLWQYDPLHRPLVQDPGIFAYISQLVAQGLAPHQNAFNEQSSLTFLFGGAAMVLGDRFGLAHVLSFRALAMVVMASIVVMTYVIGWVFAHSRAVGFLAGALMLGYQGFTIRAATTLEPKSFMLLIGLIALYFMYRRNWLWAGVFAGAAGLAWQIAWGYLIVALLLALVQGGNTIGARARAVGITLAAALAVFAVYALYFAAHGALGDMLRQTFLAPIVMHQIARENVPNYILRLAQGFDHGFASQNLFGLLSVTGLVVWLLVHFRPWQLHGLLRRIFYFGLQDRRTAGVLLVTAGFILDTFLDFQNYPDWIPLLPFVSIFAAWLIWNACLALLQLLKAAPVVRYATFAVLAVVLVVWSMLPAFASAARGPSARTWEQEQALADQLNKRLEPNAPLWLLGQADLLFFMQRHNVNKYIYVFGRVDAAVDAFEPGGFKQMVADALAQHPVMLALARIKPGKFKTRKNFQLMESVPGDYVPLQRCRTLVGGQYFVRPDRVDQLFPVGLKGCLERQ